MEKLTTGHPDEWKGNIVFDIHNHGHDFEEFLKSKCNISNVKSFEIEVNTDDFESDIIVTDNVGAEKAIKVNLVEFLKLFKVVKFNGCLNKLH